MTGGQFKRWQPHDPAWLLADCQPAFAAHPWLKDALKACTLAQSRSPYYTHFEPHRYPNQPSSNWRFQETIIIQGTREGEIALDIIQQNRVAGVGFLSRLMD